MLSAKDITPVFLNGDEVVLAHGPYEGTRGVFVRRRKDENWADISERNGSTRAHPLIWLVHWTTDARSGNTELDVRTAERIALPGAESPSSANRGTPGARA